MARELEAVEAIESQPTFAMVDYQIDLEWSGQRGPAGQNNVNALVVTLAIVLLLGYY